LVSVVIPCFNAHKTIGTTIATALQQTVGEIEVLVIDDGSTDGSQDVVATFQDPRLRFFRQANSGGPASPRNWGIRESRAPWIALLDSDDTWDPVKLEHCLALATGPVDFIAHRMRILRDGNSTPVTKMPTLEVNCPSGEEDAFQALIARRPLLPPSATLIRRSMLLAHGGFDCSAQLIAAEDLELWLRLAKSGARFLRSSEILGTYTFGPDHLTNPNRTLRSMPEIERLYFNPARRWESPAWLHVSMLAANYRALGARAAFSYMSALLRDTPSCNTVGLLSRISAELLLRL
jgi:glycosyltransferase involved in cell wall biosynthesis